MHHMTNVSLLVAVNGVDHVLVLDLDEGLNQYQFKTTIMQVFNRW